ncbi:MAG TPA: PHP domain-containing protein, partial [Rectinemataceae bacterium]|nr:PHP domain-containing protein [Rectinemataceae bacterium]
MRLLADLHNHSCLSPCASLEMSPRRIARTARERGIGLLGLTDHNAALNCPAFAEACRLEGIVPLFGIEASSIEEVHVLVLFDAVEAALDFGSLLHAHLPRVRLDRRRFGDQVVVNEAEEVLELPDQYLGMALDLGFDELCAEGARRSGLVIPAHIDRPMFSVSSQLGFLPEGPYDALESMREPQKAICRGYPLVSGSDAHYPEHVGR